MSNARKDIAAVLFSPVLWLHHYYANNMYIVLNIINVARQEQGAVVMLRVCCQLLTSRAKGIQKLAAKTT